MISTASGPLNSLPAQADRFASAWLNKNLPPNTRLQRTRLRVPLSRKPFGDSREM
jgi:hypothetical protein